jgi:acyl-CoA thioesterase-1
VEIGTGAGALITSSRTILVLGDSLSAGYGITVAQGWVALLQKRLQSQGYGYRVVNASVSGETTSGGLQRLAHALSVHKPTVLILELGANDGLRGLPISDSRANLDKMIRQAKTAGARVLLVGMKIPPNYGPRYTAQFEQVFQDLARERAVAFVPFLLERVALDAALIQADRLHPNAQAEPILLDTVWAGLKPLLATR